MSTWFANARRRLKKENKMTWSPRNRCDEDEDDDDSSLNTSQAERSSLSRSASVHSQPPSNSAPSSNAATQSSTIGMPVSMVPGQNLFSAAAGSVPPIFTPHLFQQLNPAQQQQFLMAASADPETMAAIAQQAHQYAALQHHQQQQHHHHQQQQHQQLHQRLNIKRSDEGWFRFLPFSSLFLVF